MNNEQIKELALANGFKLYQQPNGKIDLPPYVYYFADQLLETKQSEIDALKAQVAEHKSQQVLTLTKIYNCLHKANSEGLINDTIWLSNHETLFDFISSEILNCSGKVEVQQ